MILGLDISTSCTGWCILDKNGSLIDMGFIELPEKTLFEKAERVRSDILSLFKKYTDISSVAIEENLQAFRPGLSSAKTLFRLARFNGIICYIVSRDLGIEPDLINVNVARKSVGLKILSKKKGGKPTKEQVWDWVDSQVNYKWQEKVLKSGPRKGKIILHTGCFDASDAYVIARSKICISYQSSKDDNLR